MRELKEIEIKETAGGYSLGVIIFAAVAGFIAGGPAGVGMVLATITGAEGVDRLNDLRDK